MGIEHQTHFLGISNRVMDILSDTDVFVLPSRNEDLPCSILEAMASYFPSWRRTWVGSSDMVLQDKTGFLVPPENPSAIPRPFETYFSMRNCSWVWALAAGSGLRHCSAPDGVVNGHLQLYRDSSRGVVRLGPRCFPERLSISSVSAIRMGLVLPYA